MFLKKYYEFFSSNVVEVAFKKKNELKPWNYCKLSRTYNKWFSYMLFLFVF